MALGVIPIPLANIAARAADRLRVGPQASTRSV